MTRFSFVSLSAILILQVVCFHSFVWADEELAVAMQHVAKRAHLTYAKTELRELKDRFEAHRLEPKKYPLFGLDKKRFEMTEPPEELKDAITTSRWREMTAETGLVIWMSKSVLGNADTPEGYIYIDHQGDYPIQNATLHWKAIGPNGEIIQSDTVEDLHVRPKTLARACDINFYLGKARALPVPSEVEIEATLEFEGEKNNDCPFSTHYTLYIPMTGLSPTKFTGGVFGKPGEVYMKDAWGNFITKNSQTAKEMRGGDGFFSDGGSGSSSGGSSSGRSYNAPRRGGLFRRW